MYIPVPVTVPLTLAQSLGHSSKKTLPISPLKSSSSPVVVHVILYLGIPSLPSPGKGTFLSSWYWVRPV